MTDKVYKVLVFTPSESTFNTSVWGILIAFTSYALKHFNVSVEYEVTFVFWEDPLPEIKGERWDLIFVNLYPCPSLWSMIRKFLAGLTNQEHKLIGYGDPKREGVSTNWQFPMIWIQDMEAQGQQFAKIFMPEFFS